MIICCKIVDSNKFKAFSLSNADTKLLVKRKIEKPMRMYVIKVTTKKII